MLCSARLSAAELLRVPYLKLSFKEPPKDNIR